MTIFEKVAKLVSDGDGRRIFAGKTFNSLSYWLRPSGASPFPPIIYLNVNNVCNARCKMCDVGSKVPDSPFYMNLASEGDILSIEEWGAFVDDVKRFKPFLQINGTEPTLFRPLAELVGKITESGMHCQVTTNGYLLSGHAEALVEANLTRLCVSLDGPARVHDEIRGVPRGYARAWEGLGLLLELRRSRGRKWPVVGVKITVSNFNQEDLLEAIESLQPLGLDYVQIGLVSFKTPAAAELHNSLFPQYPARSESMAFVSPGEMKPALLHRQISKARSRFGGDFIGFYPDLDEEQLRVYFHEPEKALRPGLQRRCVVGWRTSQVSANGEVIPTDRCLHIVLGNIREEPFTRIWNGKRYRAYRRCIREAGLWPVCLRCGGIF